MSPNAAAKKIQTFYRARVINIEKEYKKHVLKNHVVTTENPLKEYVRNYFFRLEFDFDQIKYLGRYL